jgi:hypothetical protein
MQRLWYFIIWFKKSCYTLIQALIQVKAYNKIIAIGVSMKASTGTPKYVLTSICVNQAMMVFKKNKMG